MKSKAIEVCEQTATPSDCNKEYNTCPLNTGYLDCKYILEVEKLTLKLHELNQETTELRERLANNIITTVNSRCKNCQHFQRMKWHKCIDPEEGEQFGGKCILLARTLQLTNSDFWSKEYIHVMESFGCSMFRAKENAISKHGIQKGDIFIAADGGKYGHLVTDIETFAHVDDVVTTPFTENGFITEEAGTRIDAFKLAVVRYRKPDKIPDWVPRQEEK